MAAAVKAVETGEEDCSHREAQAEAAEMDSAEEGSRLEAAGWAAAATAEVGSISEAAVVMAAAAVERAAWEGWEAMEERPRKPPQTKVSESRLLSRDTTGGRKPRWMSTRR
jgi:hypothetical protein